MNQIRSVKKNGFKIQNSIALQAHKLILTRSFEPCSSFKITEKVQNEWKNMKQPLVSMLNLKTYFHHL